MTLASVFVYVNLLLVASLLVAAGGVGIKQDGPNWRDILEVALGGAGLFYMLGSVISRFVSPAVVAVLLSLYSVGMGIYQLAQESKNGDGIQWRDAVQTGIGAAVLLYILINGASSIAGFGSAPAAMGMPAPPGGGIFGGYRRRH